MYLDVYGCIYGHHVVLVETVMNLNEAEPITNVISSPRYLSRAGAAAAPVEKKTTIITQVREYRAKSEALARRGSTGSHSSPIRTAALSLTTPVTYSSVATWGEVGIGGRIRAGARRCSRASTFAWPRPLSTQRTSSRAPSSSCPLRALNSSTDLLHPF